MADRKDTEAENAKRWRSVCRSVVNEMYTRVITMPLLPAAIVRMLGEYGPAATASWLEELSRMELIDDTVEKAD